MQKTRGLTKMSLEGLQYYHKYDRLYLSFVMAFGFLGWILNVLLEIVQEANSETDDTPVGSRNPKRDVFLTYCFIAALLLVFILQVYAAVPLMHFLYCLMPFPLWYRLLRNRNQILKTCTLTSSRRSMARVMFRSFATVMVIELMALSFFQRNVLSLLLILGAMLSFVLSYRRTGSAWNLYCLPWATVLLLLSIFPLLPVISGNENYALVAIAGLFTGAIGLTFTFLSPPKTGADAIVIILTGTVILSTAIRLHTARSVHLGQGLPPFNQMASWILLCTLPIVPLWSKPFLTERLLTLFLAFLSLYILTSISYEGLFFVCLSIGLSLWIWIEKHFIDMKHAHSFIGLSQSREMEGASAAPALDVFDYFRIANEFIFFVVLGFFGTGNISSVNSFDPSSVFCFLTVYSPFWMGFILLVKVGIPILIVACFFNAMRIVINVNVRRVFLAAMVSTDVIALQFFFLIKDEGSWLEIGSSLSTFVIVVGFILFLIPLFELGALFLWRVDQDQSKSHQL